MVRLPFVFNDTPPTEIYTLSLHDALPICGPRVGAVVRLAGDVEAELLEQRAVLLGRRAERGEEVAHHHAVQAGLEDRKSTRLNSSHANISYAAFCLKKPTELRR